jgi:uncharacterized protein
MSTLSEATRRWLLDLARGSIASHLAGGAAPAPAELPEGATLARGCFVSLHTKSGDLRGCIGSFAADGPLWRSVRDMAIAAASRDPRFPPMHAGELEACDIEISVLSELTRATPEQVLVGTHGLCVARGFRRGVLLPQVAVEYGWDRDTFLEHTCIKAGLPGAAWRDRETTIEVFSAEIFGEI